MLISSGFSAVKLNMAMHLEADSFSSDVTVTSLLSGEDTTGWKRAGLAPPSGGLVEKKLPVPGDWRDLASSNCSVVADSEVGLI